MLIFSSNRRFGTKIKVPDLPGYHIVEEKLSVTAGVYKGPIDSSYTLLYLADTHERCGVGMSASDGGGYLPFCMLCTVGAKSKIEISSETIMMSGINLINPIAIDAKPPLYH